MLSPPLLSLELTAELRVINLTFEEVFWNLEPNCLIECQSSAVKQGNKAKKLQQPNCLVSTLMRLYIGTRYHTRSQSSLF